MVGLVCVMTCGISERTVRLRIALACVRSRNETLKKVGPLVRVRQFGMRTSESLLSEVPDAIQVQVLPRNSGE